MRTLRLASLLRLAGLALLAILALATQPAAAATIAYPDLQVLVPPSEISIANPAPGTKELQFSHITWDSGAGPLEIRPSYNALTGISQGYQALFSSPSPGVWTFDHTVPIVGPMVWVPPSDYRFPLAKFWLYNVAPEGGLGGLVTSSPKVDFCMTSDTFVGGVPNTPSTNGYASGGCSTPTGTLGLSVGWGDKYDATDGGENIDISNLPDGLYWLRAEVDPYHYLQESNLSNNITDTEIQISGNTATVLKQTQSDSTPPTVTVTSPSQGSSVSGNVMLSASASGPHPINSVQYLLDGQPIGSPVSTPPYSVPWTVGSTTPGFHYLSAQATDSAGFIGTAPAVSVFVPDGRKVGAVSFDTVVTQGGSTSVTTPVFSTSASGDVLLAFVGTDGPRSGQTSTVTGAGLNWTLVKRANTQGGDSEIWTATAPAGTALTNVTVNSTESQANFNQTLTVLALSGASGVGASAAAGAPSGAPTVSLTSTAAGSAVFAAGNDYDNAATRTLATGQAQLNQTLDQRTGDTYWSQYATAPSTAAGQVMTLSDTAPSADHYNMVGVEVLPGSAPPPPPPDEQPPKVSIASPGAGTTVSGQVQVSASATDNVGVASVQFFVNGQPLGGPVTSPPYAVTWFTTLATNGPNAITAQATDTSGNVATSAPITVTVENPANPDPCFVMDAKTFVDGHNAVTTPSFTTAEAGEQLLAFVASDGPNGAGKQSATVSGAGLTWTLLKRANARSGDAEIWGATASHPLTAVTVSSTPAVSGFDQSLTVIAMQMSNGFGASVAGGGASGAPSASLTTTEAGSLVFAVGNDWDKASARTLGTNQVLLHQQVDTHSGDTFWSQYTGQITGPTGSVVTLNDTAPTNDQWNMAAVELLSDGPGL
jgi:hypothetical protein